MSLREREDVMRKKFVIFYSKNGLIEKIGIWQKMSNNGKRAMIEFVDYLDMLIACDSGKHIDTRYKSRVVENCVWLDMEDLHNSKHSFVALRDEQLLKDAFIKSEQQRDIEKLKGDGVLNYDRSRT